MAFDFSTDDNPITAESRPMPAFPPVPVSGKATTSTTPKTTTSSDFDQKPGQADDSLSLYELFVMSRTPQERQDLSHQSSSSVFKAIDDFVQSNPVLSNIKIGGKSVGELIHSYNLDSAQSPMAFFSSGIFAHNFKKDADLAAPAQPHHGMLGIWDNIVNGFNEFRESSHFGFRVPPKHGASGFHKGEDYAMRIGTPLNSKDDAKVVFAGQASGYGKAVILEHGQGVYTLYGHLSQINAHAGQRMEEGQQFGRSGNEGVSTGAHLHFELLVVQNNKLYSVDPDLVTKSHIDLSTAQGRAEIISQTARLEGVPLARLESKMTPKVLGPSLDFS